MDKSLLDQYGEAILAKRNAEATIERIKLEVMKEIKSIGTNDPKKNHIKYNGNIGNFYISQYKTYIFSPEVERVTKELKELKQKEIALSIAKIEQKEMLIFKQNTR